jgi:hypothetical protein
MKAIHLVTKDVGMVSIDAPPDSDPLTVEDALQEAQLIDVRFEAIESRIALLFDLRMALQLRLGNAGVLVLRDVETLMWSQEARPTSRTAWNVVGSSPSVDGATLDLKLYFAPNAELRAIAHGWAEFYELEMPDLPATPPDYMREDDSTIEAGIPGWSKTARVVGSSKLMPSS